MKQYRSKKKVLHRLLLVGDDGICTCIRDNKRGRMYLVKWLKE